MTESDWLASTDPQAMLRRLNGNGCCNRYADNMACDCVRLKKASDRKLRLFACACCRLGGRDSETVDQYELKGYFDDDDKIFGIDDLSWVKRWTERGSGVPAFAVRAALLRDIVGNPYRRQRLRGQQSGDTDSQCYRCDAIRTPTVLAIAQTIYDTRTFGDMPILADALEEAGCDNQDILQHCRGMERVIAISGEDKVGGTAIMIPLRGPHARGCWVVDLILGKE